MNKPNNDKGLAATADSIRNSELNGALGAWEPIDTAPKDGTSILVFPPTRIGKSASIAKYDADKYAKKPRPYWRRDDDFGRVTESRNRPPTHWMPLPPPPV